MKIYQLQLKCFNLSEMKRFYTEDLEMELVSKAENYFAVRAGSTKLLFEKDQSTPYYHICFRTGSDYFDQMFHKLAEKSLLLSDEEGQYSMFWKGKQAYFIDPDGNILEMLERPFYWGENQPMSGWYDVSEIGMPVSTIAEMKEQLEPHISNQYKTENDLFSFYGDNEGVFVLVKEGRNWYPTDRGATIHPIMAVVSGEKEARFTPTNFPYTIIVRKETNAAPI